MSAHRSPYQAPPDLEGSFRSTNSTLFPPMPNLSLDYDSSAEPDGSSLPFQHARPSSGDRHTAGTIPTFPPVPSLRLAPGVGNSPKRANYAHSRSWTFPSTFAPSYDTQSGRNPGDSEGQSSTPFSKPVDPTVGPQNPDGSMHIATINYQRLAANLQATLFEKIMAATWEDDDGADNGGKRARASHGEDLGKRAEVSTFSARDRALANLESLHEANRFTAGGYKDYEEIVTGSLCDLADAISGVDGFTEETSLLSLTQGLEGCMLPEKTDRDTTTLMCVETAYNDLVQKYSRLQLENAQLERAAREWRQALDDMTSYSNLQSRCMSGRISREEFESQRSMIGRRMNSMRRDA